MKKLILITSLFLIITQGFAQEVTIEEAQEKSRGIIKELFEFRIFMDALKVRQFYDIHRTNTNNTDLQAEIIRFRDATKINFSVKGEVDYDHFWVWISNNPSARTPDGFDPVKMLPADYLVKFKPAWQTADPPKDNREYTCKVISNLENIKNDLTLDQNKFDEVVNNAFLDGENFKKIILRNEDIPAFANVGLFNGFKYIEQRRNLSPGDVIGIEGFTHKFLPGTEEEKFNLKYEIKETNLAEIKKVRMEVFKKTDNGDKVIYTSDDITDFTKDFTWDGQLASGENQEASYVTYAHNPLYARVVAMESDGTSYQTDAETKFNVKGELVEVTCLAFFETEDKAKPLKLEYTIDNSNDDVKFVAGKIIITDKNGEAIDNIELKKLGDILETNTVDWDPKKVKAKLKYENTPLNFEFIASTDAEFKDKYTANTTSFLNPLEITTTTSRGDFAPGIENYTNNKLKIEYEVKDVATLNSYNPKIQIYNESGETIISTHAGFDKTKKEITWDGKKDDGQFVVDADCDYEIQLQTGNGFSIFKGTLNNVDIDAEGWRNFRLSDKSPWTSFSDFNNKNTQYAFALEKSGINKEDAKRSLEYLEKHLVEDVTFLGEEIGTVNIYFVYALKLVEKAMKDNNDYADLKEYINTAKIIEPMRVSAFTETVSNHSLGFAMDINVVKNPQLTSKKNSHYLYHLIWLVTGYDLYKNTSTITEMKKVHNDFMSNLGKISTDKKTDVINRLNKFNSWGSLSEDIINNNKVYNLKDIIDGKIFEYIQTTIDDLQEYSGDDKEHLEKIINNFLTNNIILTSEISNAKNVMDDLLFAFYFDIRFSNDYTQISEYFNKIASLMQEMYLELRIIADDLDKTVPSFTFPNTPTESLNKLSKLINDHISKTLIYNEDFSSMSGKIIYALNNSLDYHGGKILDYGFFELDPKLVKYFCDNAYFAWGGLYPSMHDWMHFEIGNEWKDYSATKLQSDLHEDSIDEILAKINTLGFEQYKWNDPDKKDYIIRK